MRNFGPNNKISHFTRGVDCTLNKCPPEACLAGFYLYGLPRLLESKIGYRRTYFVTILCILTLNCWVVHSYYILTVVVIFKGNMSEKPYGKCLGPKTQTSLRMWLILGIVPPGWRLWPVCGTWYAAQSSHLLPSVPSHSMSPISLQCGCGVERWVPSPPVHWQQL